MKAGDHHRRDSGLYNFIKDPGTAANVFSRSLAADKPPVLHIPDISDRGQVVTHGVADCYTFNLIYRADPSEIIYGKILCSFA